MSEPLQHVPLPDAQLSPQLARMVGSQAPAPLRQAAARGLAPLPPPDMVVALYQIAVGSDAALASTARQSLQRLPEAVLRGALSAPLDGRVLDFVARQLQDNRSAIQLLLDNRTLPDQTVEFLAQTCEADELDRIAKDEQRLLRAPSIIAALYMNPRTRVSTAMRAVELAARNQVVVDIPGFDDLVASLQGVTIGPQHDAQFAEVVPPAGGEPAQGQDAHASEAEAWTQEQIENAQQQEERAPAEPDKKKKRFEDLPVPLQIRAATLGNAQDRALAIRSTIRAVAMAAIRSPAISIQEVVKYAANRALHEDVIRYISNRKEWTQLNAVRLALINNNKTPLGTALRLLNFVHMRDLKAISRSKNVPGPLVKAAKELISKRERHS
ncbi:MAG: hypothetical protein RMK29_05715 [Myxococcales bacterium]|nr:hypothetical protein [Myxococcota bacterium]MDW8281187.1 hypothetical protein [Myxococcales bacterium]